MPGDPFYSTQAWRETRAEVLRARPLCETPRCGRASRHADHRISRRRGGAALDPANLVALCHSCHSRKTVRADGGFGHAPRKVQPGAALDGRPSDAAHPWNRGGVALAPSAPPPPGSVFARKPVVRVGATPDGRDHDPIRDAHLAGER